VFKFASCDGCQLSLLDAEDQLLDLSGAFDIRYFPEASSRMLRGPYDIALVEGSITTHADADRIHKVRRLARTLIALGACATSGGIQSLRNWQDVGAMVRAVYPTPGYIATLATSTPISDHVPVDVELRGCPISKDLLLETLAALLAGRRPNLPAYSVCIECKRRGQVCLLVGADEPCLGPVTQAGCGAICPGFGRGCYGCFGPMESANVTALVAGLRERGLHGDVIVRLLRGFNAWSWPFRSGGDEAARAAAADEAAGDGPTGGGATAPAGGGAR